MHFSKIKEIVDKLYLNPESINLNGGHLYFLLAQISPELKESHLKSLECDYPDIIDILKGIEQFHLQKFKTQGIFVSSDLEKLDINEDEYKKLFLRTRGSKLSALDLIIALANIREVKSEEIKMLMVTRENPWRAVKRKHSERNAASDENWFSRKKARYSFPGKDSAESQLRWAETQLAHPFTPGEQKKIEEAVAANDTSSLPPFKSPESGRVYRMFGSQRFNAAVSNDKLTGFLPETPAESRAQASPRSDADEGSGIPKLVFPYTKTFNYLATLKKMDERPARHLISPSKTMASSASVHFAPLSGDSPKSKHPYHWAHLVSHWFNGPCTADNLIPATGAMNLTMLSLAEKPIANLLMNGTPEVSITVTVHYDGKSDVPIHLEYAYTYSKEDKERTLKFNFNPRSLRYLSSATKKEINLIIHEMGLTDESILEVLARDDEAAHISSPVFTP